MAYRLRLAGFVVGAVVVTACAEVAADHSKARLFEIGACLCLCAFVAWRRYGAGLIAGLLLLATLDALPGPALENATLPFVNHIVTSQNLTASDLSAWLLMVVLVCKALSMRPVLRPSKVAQWTIIWFLTGAGFWLFAVLRVWVSPGINPINAAAFGRSFAYFLVLCPLFMIVFQERRFRTACISVLAIGAVLASIGQIALYFAHVDLTPIFHTVRIEVQSGLSRGYANSDVLTSALLPLAAGGLLMLRARRAVVLGALMSIMSVAAIASQLTRANYIGSAVGIVLAICVWLMRHPFVHQVRRRVMTGIITAAIVAVMMLAFAPHSLDGFGAIVSRATSSLTAVNSSSTATSTLAVRAEEEADLKKVLGSSWPFGLGFVDPIDDYNPYLYNGTISNSDTGVYNAIMPLGVVGALVYLAPLLVLAWRLAVDGRRLDASRAWLCFGVLAWLVATLVSSLTLVTLFAPSGTPLSACLAGLGLAMLSSESRAAIRVGKLAGGPSKQIVRV